MKDYKSEYDMDNILLGRFIMVLMTMSILMLDTILVCSKSIPSHEH